LLLLSLAPQQLWVRWLSHQNGGATDWAWLVALSYVPLAAFVFFNRDRLSVKVIAVGALLNVAAMIANGGAMPAPMRLAATPATSGAQVERIAPGTKDRLVGDKAPSGLELISDRFVVTLPTGAQRVASVGDFIILFGGLIALIGAIWQPTVRLPSVGPATPVLTR
jgi:hypothetical protein